MIQLLIMRFQSTLPREERQNPIRLVLRCERFQSTLPREERPTCAPYALGIIDFNPRSHERSDLVMLISSQSHIFQSTLPREERPLQKIFVQTSKDFNPRSHERSDNAARQQPRDDIISIHAPTRGATTARAIAFFSLSSFQSTLPREERRQPGSMTSEQPYFNPRSHERSDQRR